MMARDLARMLGVLCLSAALLHLPMAAPLAAHDASVSDDAIVSACEAAAAEPELCPCTIVAARAGGVLDTELAAIFADPVAARAADTVQFNRFRRAEMQCAQDAAMAAMMGPRAGTAAGNGTTAAVGVQPDGSYSARPVRPQPLPSDLYIGQAPTNTLASQLKPVERANAGDAECAAELYIVLSETAAPITAARLQQFAQDGGAIRFASTVPSAASNRAAYRINLAGRARVLLPAPNNQSAGAPEHYTDGEIRMILRPIHGSVPDHKTADLSRISVTLNDATASQTFGAMKLAMCG